MGSVCQAPQGFRGNPPPPGSKPVQIPRVSRGPRALIFNLFSLLFLVSFLVASWRVPSLIWHLVCFHFQLKNLLNFLPVFETDF